MNSFAWLLSVVALEAAIYLVVFWLWGAVATLGLAAADFALLALVQHLRFTSARS